MQTITLAIAAAGLALAALSLGWQAATFFLSGPRVRVELREGLRGPQGVMIAPPSVYTEAGLAALEHQGYTEPVLAVMAVNHGRLPTTVNSWLIKFGNSVTYGNPNDPRNPSLPHRLEPHTSVSWYAPLDDLQKLQAEFVDQSDEAAGARAVVDLGNRENVASKNMITVGPDGTRVPTPGWIARLWRFVRRR
jgi:hypothetical protein